MLDITGSRLRLRLKLMKTDSNVAQKSISHEHKREPHGNPPPGPSINDRRSCIGEDL